MPTLCDDQNPAGTEARPTESQSLIAKTARLIDKETLKKRIMNVEYWILRFIWNLVFGIWDFIKSFRRGFWIQFAGGRYRANGTEYRD